MTAPWAAGSPGAGTGLAEDGTSAEDAAWPEDPFEVLAAWLPANDDPARPLMTLSTVSADGWPDARIVLLSELDADGLYFHTDSRSRKIAEVDATGRAALVLHLPDQARQVVVQGTVEPADPEEEARVYAVRGDYLRTLAWVNTDELAAAPLGERIAAWAAFEGGPDLAPPSTWTGRRVRPTQVRFWAGRTDAPSRRVCYTLTDAGWERDVRAG
ncbi:pyridoxamine 5'-phosphate oxidase family protein [Nocardioides sp. GY 10127]|uniref:pyridoxine/pyridoxamine 5'-phosphate oxidase n=1 Tax=Nocardioides sp. GY 10127 TaxID=2569762 RepID=UPI0010A80D98|nr:pyridoxamine 5'-phosphate oxidase family protein [Nocardioides sp. GY 10127]TIC81932.1 pyridoxine 5'-phosphate oxidase [Nocardioides sp. GY 10127]